MKLGICALVVTYVAQCVAVHVPIVNSAFEDSKTGVPPGWTLGSKDFRLIGGHGRKGVRYRYSVYARTVNLECPSGFPYIGLSFGNGSSAENCDVRTEIQVSGVRDYARYEGFIERLPDDVQELTVVLGVPKGAKGRVIFDNVDIEEMPEPSLSFMCSNVYRAMACEGEVEFHAPIYPPCDPVRCKAAFSFTDASGKVVRRAADRLSSDSLMLKVKVSELAFGTNSVAAELSFGNHVSRAAMDFTRVHELPKRRVCIDRHGRCLRTASRFIHWACSPAASTQRCSKHIRIARSTASCRTAPSVVVAWTPVKRPV